MNCLHHHHHDDDRSNCCSFSFVLYPPLYSRRCSVYYTHVTHHISVLWICWRAFVYASAFSREGKISACDPIDGKCFFENRLRWKLCLIADICVVCVSAMLRSASTHCWRLAAFGARIFNVSPVTHVTVNVRESSSLGFITAPAKCS